MKHPRSRAAATLAALLSIAIVAPTPATGAGPAIVSSEFVFDDVPTPQCHASTIAESNGRLVAAWFGGTEEKADDVGIWVARRELDGWSKPVQVAVGSRDGVRMPCWNPVLFQPNGGPLHLFYKVGPDPTSWWGMLKTSIDGGATWSAERRLPDEILGPIKNKPIALGGSTWLAPSSTEELGWHVHFERTVDGGRTWERTTHVADPGEFRAIQPTVLILPGGRLEALCRSQRGRIVATSSTDGGKSWSPLSATALPNPDSGIDALTLADGRHALIYNHADGDRSPLNLALSSNGTSWSAGLTLEREPGEYSYPAIIQAADGTIHVTSTWKRRKIRHVAIDPARLVARPFLADGGWPVEAP